MKNTLSVRKLRKKSNNYFKKLGIVNKEGRTDAQIRYIVERAANAVPKDYKRYIGTDAKFLIDSLYHQIKAGFEHAQIDPYQAFYQYGKRKAWESGYEPKRAAFDRLKNEFRWVYNHYNTYVYRLGYSSRDWFFDHAETKFERSVLYISVPLPPKMQGKAYSSLELSLDLSGDEMEAEMI